MITLTKDEILLHTDAMLDDEQSTEAISTKARLAERIEKAIIRPYFAVVLSAKDPTEVCKALAIAMADAMDIGYRVGRAYVDEDETNYYYQGDEA